MAIPFIYIQSVTPFSPILTFWQLCRSEHNEDTVNALMYGEPLDKLSLNCSRTRSATEKRGQDGSDMFKCPRSRVHVLFVLPVIMECQFIQLTMKPFLRTVCKTNERSICVIEIVRSPQFWQCKRRTIASGFCCCCCCCCCCGGGKGSP